VNFNDPGEVADVVEVSNDLESGAVQKQEGNSGPAVKMALVISDDTMEKETKPIEKEGVEHEAETSTGGKHGHTMHPLSARPPTETQADKMIHSRESHADEKLDAKEHGVLYSALIPFSFLTFPSGRATRRN
jgi:hypothetical protein